MALNTYPNTPLVVLSINGEDHNDGWTFSFNGGLDDSYFTIVDNQILAGFTPIPPGRKFVLVRAVRGLEDITRQVEIEVGDLVLSGNGGVFQSNQYIYLTGGSIPTWGSDFEIHMFYRDLSINSGNTWAPGSFYHFTGASGANGLWWEHGNSGATMFWVHGGTTVNTGYDLQSNQSRDTWKKFVIKSDDITPTKAQILIDDVPVVTDLPMWEDQINDFKIGYGFSGGSNNLRGYISNFYINVGGSNIAAEELDTNIGIFNGVNYPASFSHPFIGGL